LGGLSTPREPAEQVDDRIFTKSGIDVTKNFKEGAKKAILVAKSHYAKEAILKSNSPSCGCGKIYDGTFSGRLVDGDGIFAALLKKNKIRVMTEKEI